MRSTLPYICGWPDLHSCCWAPYPFLLLIHNTQLLHYCSELVLGYSKAGPAVSFINYPPIFLYWFPVLCSLASSSFSLFTDHCDVSRGPHQRYSIWTPCRPLYYSSRSPPRWAHSPLIYELFPKPILHWNSGFLYPCCRTYGSSKDSRLQQTLFSLFILTWTHLRPPSWWHRQ